MSAQTKGTLFFDTETSNLIMSGLPALHSEQARVMELACILDDEARNTVAELSFLVWEGGTFTISEEALRVHKISRERAESYGMQASLALRIFDSLASCASLIVAHNFAFDAQLLKFMAHRVPTTFCLTEKLCPSYCTKVNSTEVLKLPSPRGYGYKWPTLDEAYRFLVSAGGFDDAHSALADAKACRAVYYALQDRKKAAGVNTAV